MRIRTFWAVALGDLRLLLIPIIVLGALAALVPPFRSVATTSALLFCAFAAMAPFIWLHARASEESELVIPVSDAAAFCARMDLAAKAVEFVSRTADKSTRVYRGRGVGMVRVRIVAHLHATHAAVWVPAGLAARVTSALRVTCPACGYPLPPHGVCSECGIRRAGARLHGQGV